MKIRGETVKARATVQCIIPRGAADPIVLTCEALPLDYSEKVKRMFPDPRPPRVFAKDGRGKIIRDPETKVAILEDDFNDADFVAKNADAQRRQTVYLVYCALRNCSDVEFDCAKTLKIEDDHVRFIDALYTELLDSGFSMGDIALIGNDAMRASNVGAAEVEKARDSFLRGSRPDGEAASQS